jgi:hypothetical protein
LEYQGEIHYYNVRPYGSHRTRRTTDAQKQILCKEAGITLIEVPYWWDRSPLSLAATIQLHRPDLLQHYETKHPINLADQTHTLGE